MVQSLKEKIARNFSKYSGTYDQYAKLQKLSAGCLIEIVGKNIAAIPEGPLLEIGCGSGMLSEEVIKRFPERDIVLLDMAAGMLLTCRKRLGRAGFNQERIQYVERDAEKISEKDKYALIISGLTVQWFHDLPGSIEKIVNALVPEGVFLCSFLGEGSFVEWQEQCEKSRVLCTLNPLPGGNILTSRINEMAKNVTFSQQTLSLSYPSVKDFFASLKKTGTGIAVSGRRNSPSQMRTLMKEWQDSSPNGVNLICKINLISITKQRACR